MPVQAIEKTIDKHNVKIVQFYAIKGIKVKARLFKLLLPVISPFTKAVNLKDANIASLANLNMDLQKIIPEAFQKLAETLDPDNFLNLVLDLLSEVWLDNKQIDRNTFNDMFVANYSLAYKLCVEVIKENHFFELGGIGNLLVPEQMTPAPPEKSEKF